MLRSKLSPDCRRSELGVAARGQADSGRRNGLQVGVQVANNRAQKAKLKTGEQPSEASSRCCNKNLLQQQTRTGNWRYIVLLSLGMRRRSSWSETTATNAPVQDEAVQAVLGMNQKHILLPCPGIFQPPSLPQNFPLLPTSPPPTYLCPPTFLTSFPAHSISKA
jgi:hypothetical protein